MWITVFERFHELFKRQFVVALFNRRDICAPWLCKLLKGVFFAAEHLVKGFEFLFVKLESSGAIATGSELVLTVRGHIVGWVECCCFSHFFGCLACGPAADSTVRAVAISLSQYRRTVNKLCWVFHVFSVN